MEYLVFPFGKYKGVKLQDLPSTYIVLALEKFDLPSELEGELLKIIYGRLNVFSATQILLSKNNEDKVNEILNEFTKKYENNQEGKK